METFLEGITLTKFLLLYALALLGMITSILAHQVKYAKKIQRMGGFKMATWVNENWQRSALTLIVMLIGIIFSEETIGIPLTPWAAFLAGFTTDKIIDSLLNRK